MLTGQSPSSSSPESLSLQRFSSTALSMATPTSSGTVSNDTTLRSASQNPRWKRHASLDAGVGQFRARKNSWQWNGHLNPNPLSFNSNGRRDDEKRLLFDFPPNSSPPSPTALFASLPKRRGFVSFALLVLGLVVFGGFGGVAWSHGGRRGAEHMLEDFGLMSQPISG